LEVHLPRIRLVVPLLLVCATPALAQAATRPTTFSEQFPWLKDFIAAVLGIAMICVMLYFFRPAGQGIADFSIEVDGEDVRFKGRVPEAARAAIEDFLLNDCRIEGSYEVIGKWHESHLAIHVRGDNAKPLEQRIRNFLKLNVKRP
jgi:hypothetical protein